MISRQGFDNSSAWFLERPRRGGFHTRWISTEDGFSIQHFEFASPTDRDYSRRQILHSYATAYEEVLSELVSSIEQDVVERFENPRYGTTHLSARLKRLPADVNPYHLNSGKGVAGDVLFFLDPEDADRMLIASAPESRGDMSRRAEFIQVEKRSGFWHETDVAPELAADATFRARAVRAMWVCDGLARTGTSRNRLGMSA